MKKVSLIIVLILSSALSFGQVVQKGFLYRVEIGLNGKDGFIVTKDVMLDEPKEVHIHKDSIVFGNETFVVDSVVSKVLKDSVEDLTIWEGTIRYVTNKSDGLHYTVQYGEREKWQGGNYLIFTSVDLSNRIEYSWVTKENGLPSKTKED